MIVWPWTCSDIDKMGDSDALSSQIQIQIQLKIQIQTHRYKAYFLTVEMMQWQLKRLVVLELWRTHTKLLGLPHFRKILDFFALFSAAFNHIPFPGKGPSLECLLPAILRGCNYVRWVERGGMGGTRAGGCLWGAAAHGCLSPTSSLPWLPLQLLWPPRTPPPAPPATYSRCSQVLGLNLKVSLPVQGLVQPSLLVVVALWGRPASAHGGILSPAVVAVRPAEQMWL